MYEVFLMCLGFGMTAAIVALAMQVGKLADVVYRIWQEVTMKFERVRGEDNHARTEDKKGFDRRGHPL